MMKKQSMLRKMLIASISTTILITLLFVGAIFGGGSVHRLKTSSYKLLEQRVQYRSSDLHELLTRNLYQTKNYTEIMKLSKEIYENRDQYKDASIVSEKLLNSMEEISHVNDITGSFIIFDSSVFDTSYYPALYFSDSTPENAFPDKSDLVAHYGDAQILKENSYILDVNWRPYMEMEEDDLSYAFYFKPFRAGQQHPDEESLHLAYWSSPVIDNKVVSDKYTFSFPLFGDDHKVYAVLGFDINIDYLNSFLPYEELNDGADKAYVLANKKTNENTYTVMECRGPTYSSKIEQGSTLQLKEEKEGNTLIADSISTPVTVVKKQIKLFESNSPFETEEWYLLGLVDKDELYASANRLFSSLVFALVGALSLGITIAIYTSIRFTQPIAKLATHLNKIRHGDVKLPRVQIIEIDNLSRSIEDLSKHLSSAESRLSQIIHAMDMPIGAIEVYDENTIYCTEDVPYLMHFKDKEKTMYTKDEFHEAIKSFKKQCDIYEDKEEQKDGKYMQTYVVQDRYDEQENIWLRFTISIQNDNKVVVINNVSDEIQEKQKLTYERDHDILTHLLNRGAFKQQVEGILSTSDCGICAMILWDLDNLKTVNDTYGHDAGDCLIRATADCLKRVASSKHCVVSRMAGDEFLVFFHHFDNRDVIMKKIERMHHMINHEHIDLGGPTSVKIRISAGVAWYPDDALDFGNLSKYADFAMYDVKNSQKGGIHYFNASIYQKDKLLFNGRDELNEILDKHLIRYAYQPIVNAKTGEIFAFEALMRPLGKILTTPYDVMRLARAQSQLYRVEYITWTQSIKQFISISKQYPNAKLFINSIPSIPLLHELVNELEKNYVDFLHKLVIELIESDEIEEHYLHTKQLFAEKWNAQLAIDDYGSGYSSGATLLHFHANYIKIDMGFIQGISHDHDRFTLVEDLIHYAHRKDIMVIAEGVETKEDMDCLLHMQVDLLQGYYLSKPMFIIEDIPDEVKRQILNFAAEHTN